MLSPSTYFSFAWISVLRVHDGDRISLKGTIPPWATCKRLPLLKWSKSWTSEEIFILSHIYKWRWLWSQHLYFWRLQCTNVSFRFCKSLFSWQVWSEGNRKNLYHIIVSPSSVSVLWVKHVMPVEDFNDLFPTPKLLISEMWLPPIHRHFCFRSKQSNGKQHRLPNGLCQKQQQKVSLFPSSLFLILIFPWVHSAVFNVVNMFLTG